MAWPSAADDRPHRWRRWIVEGKELVSSQTWRRQIRYLLTLDESRKSIVLNSVPAQPLSL